MSSYAFCYPLFDLKNTPRSSLSVSLGFHISCSRVQKRTPQVMHPWRCLSWRKVRIYHPTKQLGHEHLYQPILSWEHGIEWWNGYFCTDFHMSCIKNYLSGQLDQFKYFQSRLKYYLLLTLADLVSSILDFFATVTDGTAAVVGAGAVFKEKYIS